MHSSNIRNFIKIIIFVMLTFISLNSFSGTACIGDNYGMVVVDMQSYYITRSGFQTNPNNITKKNKLISNQIAAIKIAMQNNIPIIFMEYIKSGDTISELKEAVKDYKNVTYFIKNTDGMFDWDNAKLNELTMHFIKKQIGNIVILGANGGACVQESINGAFSNKCNVLVYSDGIADFNFKEFIYPYTYNYRSSTSCPSCSLRKTDDLDLIAFELASKQTKIKKIFNNKINDTNRELTEKEDTIKEIKNTIKNSKNNQTTTK